MMKTVEKCGKFEVESLPEQGTAISITIDAKKIANFFHNEQRKVIRRRVALAGIGLLLIFLATLLYSHIFPDKHFMTYQFKTSKKMDWLPETGKYEMTEREYPDEITFYNAMGKKIKSHYAGDHSVFLTSILPERINITQYNDINLFRREIKLDVDQDGQDELVIGIRVHRMDPNGPKNLPARLIFFESGGTIKWEKKLASPNIYRHIIDDRHSKMAALDIQDFDFDGEMEILTVAQRWYYPCQILLLDINGNVLFEYWHPGFLVYCGLGVGKSKNDPKKLIFRGINNAEEWSAVCLSIDANFEGGQALPFKGNNIEPAKEDRYVLYKPHPDIKREFGICNIEAMEIAPIKVGGPTNDKKICWRLDIQNGVSLWLNIDFLPQEVTLKNHNDLLYRSYWHSVRSRGGIDRDFTSADIALQTDRNYCQIYCKGEFVNQKEHEKLMADFKNKKSR